MIVYLAWGSLYWNPDTLPIEHWVHSSLELPLEFSRISDQGKGRLTLVIDTINGQDNKVWYAPSKLSNVNQAINALKDRERTIIKNIAYINLKANKRRVNHTPPELVEIIKKWAKDQQVDTVIWTDLQSNWKELMHDDYTVERAYQYFEKSDLDVRLKILEYIYKAKNLTKIHTPFSKYFFERLHQELD